MIEKMEKFFEYEYNRTRPWVLNKDGKFQVSPSEAVWNAVYRCMGVAEFVYNETGEYSKIESVYEFYKEKLIKLLDERE